MMCKEQEGREDESSSDVLASRAQTHAESGKTFWTFLGFLTPAGTFPEKTEAARTCYTPVNQR